MGTLMLIEKGMSVRGWFLASLLDKMRNGVGYWGWVPAFARTTEGKSAYEGRRYGGGENSTLVGWKRVVRAWSWRDHIRAFSCFS